MQKIDGLRRTSSCAYKCFDFSVFRLSMFIRSMLMQAYTKLAYLRSSKLTLPHPQVFKCYLCQFGSFTAASRAQLLHKSLNLQESWGDLTTQNNALSKSDVFQIRQRVLLSGVVSDLNKVMRC
jgi:hypothetical protein